MNESCGARGERVPTRRDVAAAWTLSLLVAGAALGITAAAHSTATPNGKLTARQAQIPADFPKFDICLHSVWADPKTRFSPNCPATVASGQQTKHG